VQALNIISCTSTNILLNSFCIYFSPKKIELLCLNKAENKKRLKREGRRKTV
jgi:hypothetical protein